MRLEYYRLQKISEGSISLRDGDARPLDGPTDVGSGLDRTQPVPLSVARKQDLPDAWIRRLEQHSPDRRQVLSVVR